MCNWQENMHVGYVKILQTLHKKKLLELDQTISRFLCLEQLQFNSNIFHNATVDNVHVT